MFRMKIPDTMIDDTFKKSVGYKYCKSKKAEIEKSKAAEELEDKVSLQSEVEKERLYAFSSDTLEERTDDTDNFDMDLSDDSPQGDDDAAGFDFMSNPVYTDAQTTSTVIYPKGNPELTIYISGASKVPLGTHVDVQATNPNSLQAKAKKLMQKAKKNMRKINFKKAVAHKFSEYDQKLEALTNFNVFEAFEKAIQARVLTEIKKLLPTHIPKTLANYVKLHLNTFVLENENHILRPSTVVIAKKLKAIIQKEELTIADFEGAELERLKQQYHNNVELEYHVDQLKAAVLSEAKWNSDENDVSKPRSFERHTSKNTKPHPSFYNNNFYYIVSLSTEEKYTTSLTKHYAARYNKQGIDDMISDRWCKETHSYIFEALNGIYHLEDYRIDFFKAEIINRSDNQKYEFSYADLPRLSLNDVEDMYLLQNKVEDIHVGVESYQQTLSLTKTMMFFEGIDQKIPFTMTTTHKRVVYLNQHNVKSLMRLSKLKKFYDGTLMKIQENLIDMVIKNKLGKGNKRLNRREWTDNDVMKSNKMVRKIDQTLKRRE
ncbi:hypothetical protein Tco_0837893 [Tanacetum coccineum]